ncbi:unnamed protein product [Meganyctiphanes norvegica]|uniref:Protein HIRA n=1 Tax=Meganyctiphanes norvegica TaxID=48144 RepID=A0AAV2PZP0_MEGNR
MQLLKPTWVNHDGDKAIFSVDVHPDGSRFATGGQGVDSSGRVVIWNLKPLAHEKFEEDDKVPKLLCQLDQHLGCVNCVRWSRGGRYLASAGDDKVIIIWQLSSYGGGSVFGSNVVNVESWRSVSTLRGHNGDVLDVAWSPGDVWLASASIDNNIIIWNTTKWPEQIRVLRGHEGMVKGVTWDPVGKYLASQADDKKLFIWRTSDWTPEERIAEPFKECGGTTSVLRPSWSPDGQYLVSAHAMNNGGPTAQIIERDGWATDKDFVGHRKPITCVRFNPNILKKKDPKTNKPLQYCCVAIGSRDRSISIWFTSLKRPLVVVHDIFDDSVLDLSWSKCGRYLLAVSKDGTLSFIQFSPQEIGNSLTEDETNAFHIKFYGKSATATVSAPTIIENPEMVRMREEERQRANAITNREEQRPCPPTPQRNPINKQIETRTVDGKRRITPMFFPRPPDGAESLTQNFEASFSSSCQEKSKIVVERVEGVVQPNVSTPTKPWGASNSPNKSLPAEFNGVAPGLCTRLESSLPAISEKPSERTSERYSDVSMIGVKRKHEDAQPIAVKRKRGRPPQSSLAPTRPHTPEHIRSQRMDPVGVTTVRPSMMTNSKVVTQAAVVLPEAMLTKSARIQIPGSKSADGPTPMLVVENDFKVASGSLPSLHRISRSEHNENDWSCYLTSSVLAATATATIAALACRDKSLHIIDIATGDLLLPPLQLQGRASQLCIHENTIVVLTTEAWLNAWDLTKKKKIVSESVGHLLEGRSGGVKTIQISQEGSIVILLTSGEAFTRCPDLDSWLQLGESASVRRALQPEYTVLPPCNPHQADSRPFAALLHQTSAYSGASRISRPVISDDIRNGLTEAFLNRMMTSSLYLKSPQDYKFWLKRRVQFLIKEGLEDKLRSLFDDLMGPRHSGTTVKPSTVQESKWLPKTMNFDKQALLEEFLREILVAENSLQLQRLYSEYKEQLHADNIDAI